MPPGGERKSRGSRNARDSADTGRRKLPGDDMAEVLYLTPADDESEPNEKNDVADRFDEIDDLFGDDLGDEPDVASTPKKRAQTSSWPADAPADAPAEKPRRFPGVTFVEVFLPCRRANCNECDGANGSSPQPVAVSHPIDKVGRDRQPGEASDFPSSARQPGDPSGLKPGAASEPEPTPDPAADEPEPVTPERPAPRRTPLRPGSAPAKPAARPTRPVAARQEPADRADAPQEANPSRPSASGQEHPASEPGAPTAREPTDAQPEDVEWRGRLDLEEQEFEFTSETGARGLRRHGGARPAPKPNASESDDDEGDLQSRLDRILERAKRIGYQPLSGASERSSGPPTRAVDRQSFGGPTE